MNHKLFNNLCLGSLLAGPLLAFSQVTPNFVFIIADDVSWNDIGCYGNKGEIKHGQC